MVSSDRRARPERRTPDLDLSCLLMGSTYQTILAVGESGDVQRAIDLYGRPVAITPVGERRWAVVPQGEHGYAETAPLAELLSQTGYAATFEVHDSDVLTSAVYRNGGVIHEYLSDQAYLVEYWDDEGNELLSDMLGRSYRPGETPPHGPAGADPDAFAALGVEPLDHIALAAALNAPTLRADSLHHGILHALNLTPGPLQRTYEESS
jgi:hypothetical protein